VQQGTVIYCAFEGAHGYRKRCEAFRRCHGLTDEDPPIYVVPGRADLIKDHSALIKDMHGQLGASATTVRCVVLDTLNKSLIGSESKDVDMANYIAAAEAIQATFNCVVIIVHHHGIDESRPRGHTSLRGAVAAQIKITRDEQNNIIAEIEDMRDGPDGAQILSRLAVVDVGTDVAGKPLTSAAVEPIETGVGAGGRKLPKLTKNQRTFFSILQSVATGLTADEWYEQARQAGLGAKRRADLHDLRSSLKNRGLVQQTENRWFVAAEYRKCSD
jgi:AAA domain